MFLLIPTIAIRMAPIAKQIIGVWRNFLICILLSLSDVVFMHLITLQVEHLTMMGTKGDFFLSNLVNIAQ